MTTDNVVLLMISITLFGFFNSPIMSLATEMACNTCFPIGEGLVAGT